MPGADARQLRTPARVMTVMDQLVLAEVIRLALSHGPFHTRTVRDENQEMAMLDDLQLCADELGTNGETITQRWTARATSPRDAGDSAIAGRVGSLIGETRVSVAGGPIVESWTSWSAAEVFAEIGIFQRTGDETS